MRSGIAIGTQRLLAKTYPRLQHFRVYGKRAVHLLAASLFSRLLRLTKCPAEFCFRPEPYIVVDGIKLFYESSNVGNVLCMDVLGSWESLDLDFIFSRVADDGVFYDIGANIGWYTLNIAKRKPKVKIVCFEPQPDMLVRNLELNGIDRSRVTVVECALGEANMAMRMTSSYRSENFITEKGGMAVTVRRLDDLVTELSLPAPSIVKIDVEGYEYSALKGGEKTLSRSKATILCEINDLCLRYGRDQRELTDFLGKIGYETAPREGLTNHVFVRARSEYHDAHSDQVLTGGAVY